MEYDDEKIETVSQEIEESEGEVEEWREEEEEEEEQFNQLLEEPVLL